MKAVQTASVKRLRNEWELEMKYLKKKYFFKYCIVKLEFTATKCLDGYPLRVLKGELDKYMEVWAIHGN